MRPVSDIPSDICRNIRFVFCDIDDTLTWHGKLPAESFAALWKLQKAGIKVIPITGRPGGWVDHFARMWPADAVIGENGAFIFWMENNKINRYYLQSEMERQANRIKLNKIAAEVLKEVPGSAIAADQSYREIDLAIDFCEDVPALSEEKINQIVNIFHKYGAQAKISSIHVNGWFGKFNKFSTLKILLTKFWLIDFMKNIDTCLFVGDSPNDEPIFKEFAHSVGVANVKQFAARMNHLPRYITDKPGGFGFAEMAEIILEKRGINKF